MKRGGSMSLGTWTGGRQRRHDALSSIPQRERVKAPKGRKNEVRVAQKTGVKKVEGGTPQKRKEEEHIRPQGPQKARLPSTLQNN